jgi:hypothetical protein
MSTECMPGAGCWIPYIARGSRISALGLGAGSCAHMVSRAIGAFSSVPCNPNALDEQACGSRAKTSPGAAPQANPLG